MTGPAPEGSPPPADLTARVFRALYPEYDLHDLDGTYLAVPAGTPCFTAPAIGEVARQISAQACSDLVLPAARPCPDLPRRP